MSSTSNPDQIIFQPVIGAPAYLAGAKAAVVFASPEYSSDKATDAKDVKVGGGTKKYMPWGETDDYPIKIRDAVYSNPTLSRGQEFNIVTAVGKSVRPVLRNPKDGTTSELAHDHPVSLWFQDNDINTWWLEQSTDLILFFNTFNELILAEDGKSVFGLNHKEAMFSRLELKDAKTFEINNHFYCGKFGTGETIAETDVTESLLLPSKYTYSTLLGKTGQIPQSQDSKQRRFVLQGKFPTAGSVYYPRPYWTSILSSGWLEFANKIPEFKKALMTNQITIKYVIVFDQDYFPTIFKNEGITDQVKQKARIATEYENLNTFLTDTKNTAKSFVTYAQKIFGKNGAQEYRDMVTIKPIENLFKGGEFIEDSAEANNIISYAIGVHPLITGANPSKNGSINGTEARELFNLKRVLLWPYRSLLLKPLYLIKRFNKWDPNIYFAIDDIALTTLDKDPTGMTTITTIM